MPPREGRHAARVAAGIFLSRIAGLVRQRIFARYLGLSDAADALAQAFRIPNLLQNLFGEGVLSASFIPVYARLISEGKKEEAKRVAEVVATLLGLTIAVLVALGMLTTPVVVSLLAPGFTGEKRELTITLVRILFPATGLLVGSAWCLGVLNSHREFFRSYVAPVWWNVAIIAAAIYRRDLPQDHLATTIAFAAVVGSAIQVAAQLGRAVELLGPGSVRLTLAGGGEHVRAIVRNFWPALMGRGVNQISAYVDGVIASLLGTGAAMAVANAQTLYTLPVSLFGMSISAAELPAMSSVEGNDAERAAALRTRLRSGLERIAFFVIPCTVAFLTLGQVVSAVLFQNGRFTQADSQYVAAILAGSAIGLLASTLSRLTSSAFYALGDTRTPLRYAIVRVVLTTILGFGCGVWLPPRVGLAIRWGAVGLTATAGISAWIEFALLRRSLAARIGQAALSVGYQLKLWTSALVAAGIAWGVVFVARQTDPVLLGALTLIPYGAVYAGMTLWFRIPAAWALIGRSPDG